MGDHCRGGGAAMGCSTSSEAISPPPKQKRVTVSKNDIVVCDSKKWVNQEKDAYHEKHKAKKNPWSKMEDPSMKGHFFYVNSETGEQTREEPPDFHQVYHKSTGLKGLQAEHDAEIERNSPELKPKEPEKKKRKGHIAAKNYGMGEQTMFEAEADSILKR